MEGVGTPDTQVMTTRTSVTSAWKVRPTWSAGPEMRSATANPSSGLVETMEAVEPTQRATIVPPAVDIVRSTGSGAGLPPPPAAPPGPPEPAVPPGEAPGAGPAVRARTGSLGTRWAGAPPTGTAPNALGLAAARPGRAEPSLGAPLGAVVAGSAAD